MPPVVAVLLAFVCTCFRSRLSMQMELIALRHQVAVYTQSVSRLKLRPTDRLFWVWLSRLWPRWQQALAFVQPRTVIAWQKTRFRDYWRCLSRHGKPGRPALSKEVRARIQDMWRSNPTWGSPRIVGELRKLGLNVATSTVEKYRPRTRTPSSPTWKAFLSNHVTDIVACDFFTVPTATFRVLFVFIVLAHERRRIVHFNITEHPTAQWTAQQIVEAFPWETASRYLLRDRDAIYGAQVPRRIKSMGIEEVMIAPRSPWPNPYCERVIGSIRRECLNDIMVLDERHLRRVLQSYVHDYHTWRTHRSLAMDAPEPRAIEPPAAGPVKKLPEVGGLHHHYARRAAWATRSRSPGFSTVTGFRDPQEGVFLLPAFLPGSPPCSPGVGGGLGVRHRACPAPPRTRHPLPSGHWTPSHGRRCRVPGGISSDTCSAPVRRGIGEPWPSPVHSVVARFTTESEETVASVMPYYQTIASSLRVT